MTAFSNNQQCLTNLFNIKRKSTFLLDIKKNIASYLLTNVNTLYNKYRKKK